MHPLHRQRFLQNPLQHHNGTLEFLGELPITPVFQVLWYSTIGPGRCTSKRRPISKASLSAPSWSESTSHDNSPEFTGAMVVVGHENTLQLTSTSTGSPQDQLVTQVVLGGDISSDSSNPSPQHQLLTWPLLDIQTSISMSDFYSSTHRASGSLKPRLV